MCRVWIFVRTLAQISATVICVAVFATAKPVKRKVPTAFHITHRMVAHRHLNCRQVLALTLIHKPTSVLQPLQVSARCEGFSG